MSPPRPGDARAERLLADHLAVFPGAHAPVPVEEIAEDLLGLRVHLRRGLRVSGMLVPDRRAVYLNADEAPVRRRFTLAHELGHWVVHCAGAAAPPRILCRSDETTGSADVREREANVFAATLLMPEAGLAAGVADGLSVADLAAAYGVSGVAMAWRLYNVGLGPQPSAG